MSFASRRPLLCVAVLGMLSGQLGSGTARAQNFGPNVLQGGNFDAAVQTYVPWAGVDSLGNIHGLDGQQITTGDDGVLRSQKFGPSVAVADLNGDGKPDLVLADSKGFFWFFPNSGTPQKPAFTQGEVIPIWLGEERVDNSREGVDNITPRIQLLDFDHNGRPDIVAGTYAGKLFRIKNAGSSSQPDFKPTYNRETQLINTRAKGRLWCNYLAPYLTNSFGSLDSLDLIMGEGTYSANSIYLLRNTDSSRSPRFDESHTEKIIPGMGLEQLTPVVIDWNNDGKPDILTGDRTGYLTLYLNTSSDQAHPTFANGTHVKIAGVDKLGNTITVTVCDLTGNGLPNLLVGRDDGTIAYALNTGKVGAPVFSTPLAPLKGVLPPGYNYMAPSIWIKDGAWGAPDELIACVNPQLEPGFAFPEGITTKYALKFSVWPVKNILFPDRYYPPIEDQFREHVIRNQSVFALKTNTRYRIHGWVKCDGNATDLRYKLWAARIAPGSKFRGYDIMNPISVGSSWTEFNSEIKVENNVDPAVKNWNYNFEFRFTGQPTLYFDDIQIQEKM